MSPLAGVILTPGQWTQPLRAFVYKLCFAQACRKLVERRRAHFFPVKNFIFKKKQIALCLSFFAGAFFFFILSNAGAWLAAAWWPLVAACSRLLRPGGRLLRPRRPRDCVAKLRPGGRCSALESRWGG